MKKGDERYGEFSELKLMNYWKISKEWLAAEGGWLDSTIKSYERYVGYLSEHIDKEISSITMDDIKYAIFMLSVERGYCDNTLKSILSIIRGIFKYAHAHGDAYNIFRHYKPRRNEVSLDEILCSTKNRATKKADIQKEREKLAAKPKSLNTLQIEVLVRHLWEKITTDGRLCLIALMLYCGVRPAEGRALLWGDIKEFIDHPDREFVSLFKIRDRNGVIKDIMKTPNAYRRIPIHIELAALLKKRRDYIIAELGTENIDNLPICCFENIFDRPCKDWEVAMVAEDILSNIINIGKDVMRACAIEHASEMLEEEEDGKEVQHLSLYVLRKNFWTWIQALTTLSDDEKYVLMGHELETDKRELFNNDIRLWNMCQKLDKAVLSKMLREEHLYISPMKGNASVDDCGIVRIGITQDMLRAGEDSWAEKESELIRGMQINLIAEEAGDNICIRLRNLPAEFAGIKLKTESHLWPARDKKGINCSYANWLAHETAEKQILQKSAKSEISVETPICEFDEADASCFEAQTDTSKKDQDEESGKEVNSETFATIEDAVLLVDNTDSSNKANA